MSLDAASVGATLRTERYGRSLDLRAETGSTNDDARAAADAGCADGHVVVADRQRAGRGSQGRTWDSPAGVDLYFSIVARVPLEAPRLPPLTLAVGLGVAEAIEPLAGRARVKWPNDVLLEDRKCAGILVETVSVGARVDSAIIGVGVGVNRTSFAPPLDATATSMRIASGRELDRADVLARLLGAIERRVDRYLAAGPEDAAAAVDERLAWRGERVRIGELEGELLGVHPTGAIRLATANGERVLASGRIERA